jgi:hypothetical protein
VSTRRRALSRVLVGALFAAAHPLGAQTVLLEIRPRAGDTLRLRLDQEVDLTATRKVGRSDSSMRVKSSMQLLSRAIVESGSTSGTIVIAVADSVGLVTNDGHGAALLEETRRSLLGKRVRMLVAPDGSARMLDTLDDEIPQLRYLISLMPATLPRAKVHVGQTWSQVMEMPIAGQPGERNGTLNATFRLDSLTQNDQHAFLSIWGVLTREPPPSAPANAPTRTMSGTVRGTMKIDRRRGWMTDARAHINVNSTLTPAPGSNVAPMRFHVRIWQRMRAQ